MIGNLIFDKSSKDLNLFLYSVYLIGQYGCKGEIYRNFHTPCFVECMASYMGCEAYKEKDGVLIEERAIYNKSLFAQYYGFIERKKQNNKELLCLTNRGRMLYGLIECNEKNSKCSINSSTRSIFQDLVWYSILYDSFGKNNDGAQTSHTDIDAPKVIFRTIIDLGQATNEEIFYVLFSLNKGDKGKLNISKGYSDLLDEIKRNRVINKYDYSSFFEDNGLTNKVSDSKIIDLFSDPLLCILEKKENNGNIFNNLSHDCRRFLDDSNLFECSYFPHNFIFYSENNEITKEWLKLSLLNKNRDNVYAIWMDLTLNITPEEFQDKLSKALLESLQYSDRKKIVVVTTNNELELVKFLGPFVTLLKRKNSITDGDHGYSEDTLTNASGESIKFPMNFQIIAIVNKQ